MVMKLSIRDGALSFGVFCGVLFALTTVDPRVQDRLTDLVGSGHVGSNVGPWTQRLGELGDALLMAARHQSLENAPLLVFATVGTVLTIFMFKS
jgi:hypothetical protein